MLDNQLAISVRTEKSWKETVDATRALMEAGLANEAAVSQMEATYYTICTSVLDLKEQINHKRTLLSSRRAAFSFFNTLKITVC
jgi:outer membrane protein, multidrug efflux system